MGKIPKRGIRYSGVKVNPIKAPRYEANKESPSLKFPDFESEGSSVPCKKPKSAAEAKLKETHLAMSRGVKRAASTPDIMCESMSEAGSHIPKEIRAGVRMPRRVWLQINEILKFFFEPSASEK